MTQSTDLFDGKTWLVYGSLGMPKAEIVEAITSRGGRVVSSVSGKLDFLVWSNETLVPGDTTGAVKPKKLLALGGVAVGEADFGALLEGTVSSKLSSFLAARAGAAAKAKPAAKQVAVKKPAAKQAKKAAPKSKLRELTVEALLERSECAVAKMTHLEQARIVEGLVEQLFASGHAKLGVSLARALPELYRGHALLTAALAGEATVDEAIDLILWGIANTDSYDQPERAARALEAAALLDREVARASELTAPADAIVDQAFAGTGKFRSLEPILASQLKIGAHKSVRRIVERWRDADPDSLGDALRRSKLIWVFVDDPRSMLAFVNAIPNPADRDFVICKDGGLQACADWVLADLEELVALAPSIRTELGRVLLEAGREQDARHFLFTDTGAEVPVTVAVEHHLVVGETDRAKTLLSGEPPMNRRAWTRLRLAHGIESVAEARERIRHPGPASGNSVMLPIEDLLDLAGYLLDDGSLDGELDALFEPIDSLLGSSTRTAYDRGVEAAIRGKVASVRARVLRERGDVDGLREVLEANLADLKNLHAYAKDTYQKNEVTKSLVRRAVDGGQPELALQAAKKITKADRPAVASQVALSFLPGDPARALEVVETLGGDQADGALIGDPSRTSLLVALWTVVLGTGAEA